MRSSSCWWLLWLLAACTWSCKSAQPEPVEQAPAVTPAPQAQPVLARSDIPKEWAKGPSPDPVGYPKPGWSKQTLDDTLPLCVFSDAEAREAAQFIEQVKSPKLAANHSLVFGAFAPHCINEACDDLATLQCSVRREGTTLTVTAHYWAYHKEGSSCSEECAEITAACETPPLEPGKYTVRYGNETYSLQVPSRLRAPCLNQH